jgi:high-affinity nickel permease
MINFPNLGAAALWRAGLVALLVWAAGGLLDGATLGELVGVPILVAAWMSAVVLIDRLIMRQTSGWSINRAG